MQIDLWGIENGFSFVGTTVTLAHFGGNLLFDRDRPGDLNSAVGPSQTFDDAVRELGVTGLRYPGGTLTESHFDINNPNSSLQNIGLTDLFDPDRAGPDAPTTLGLNSALDFAAAERLSFTLVLPTFRFLSAQRDSNGNRFEVVDTNSITELVRNCLTEAARKGVHMAAFELGNEWWVPIDDSLGGAMSAIEYGRIASRLALTVQQAIDEFKVGFVSSNWQEPEIVVQVGRGGTLEWVTPDGNRPPENYEGSLVKATTLIFNEFDSKDEQNAVDGLVTHRFLSGNIENVSGWAYKPFETWSTLAVENQNYKQLTKYVTEWNVKASNSSYVGVEQPRALLSIFQEMVEAGVNGASIWGIQQNNESRLTMNAGWTGESFGGLTAAGQIFQLMADSLVGLRSLNLSGAQPGLEVAGFGCEQRAVLFFSNITSVTGSYTFDASELPGQLSHVWARTIRLDSLIPNGETSLPWVEIHAAANANYIGLMHFDLAPNEIILIEATFGDVGVSMSGAGRDDWLSGSNFNDSMLGGAGSDQLLGKGGNDKIFGGDGADTLNGGSGSDTLDGGDGFDIANYSGSASPIRVDLQFSHVNSFDAAGDTFKFVEGILGSNFDDNLSGDSLANDIFGSAGNDFLRGRGGDDSCFGGEGNDVIWGGVGADRMIGGGGRDRAQYSESTSGVLVDLAFRFLNTGEASGDIYESIEDIFGSSYNDRLRGDAGNNIIWGGDGKDFLQGREGNDVLYGGSGSDTFFFAKNWGSDKVIDFERGQDFINFVGFGIVGDNKDEYFEQVGSDLAFEFGMSRLLILNSTYESISSNLVFLS